METGSIWWQSLSFLLSCGLWDDPVGHPGLLPSPCWASWFGLHPSNPQDGYELVRLPVQLFRTGARCHMAIFFFFYRLCDTRRCRGGEPPAPMSMVNSWVECRVHWIVDHTSPPIFFFYPTPQTLSSALLLPGKTVWESAEERLVSGDHSLPFCGHPSPDTPCISLLWRKHVSILR